MLIYRVLTPYPPYDYAYVARETLPNGETLEWGQAFTENTELGEGWAETFRRHHRSYFITQVLRQYYDHPERS